MHLPIYHPDFENYPRTIENLTGFRNKLIISALRFQIFTSQIYKSIAKSKDNDTQK